MNKYLKRKPGEPHQQSYIHLCFHNVEFNPEIMLPMKAGRPRALFWQDWIKSSPFLWRRPASLWMQVSFGKPLQPHIHPSTHPPSTCSAPAAKTTPSDPNTLPHTLTIPSSKHPIYCCCCWHPGLGGQQASLSSLLAQPRAGCSPPSPPLPPPLLPLFQTKTASSRALWLECVHIA